MSEDNEEELEDIPELEGIEAEVLIPEAFDQMHKVPQDTPIKKASLTELSLEQQKQFIEALQARRLIVHKAVTKARTAKEKTLKDSKASQAAKFEKLQEKFEKALAKVDTELLKAEKLFDELVVYLKVAGEDHDFN